MGPTALQGLGRGSRLGVACTPKAGGSLHPKAGGSLHALLPSPCRPTTLSPPPAPPTTMQVPLLPLPPMPWHAGIVLHDGTVVTAELHATLAHMVALMNKVGAGPRTFPVGPPASACARGSSYPGLRLPHCCTACAP